MTAAGPVGLALAGAGARGAYEAGALSVLLPRLAAAGDSPTILSGTSAGALNVVGLAGYAHRGWGPAAQDLVGLWSAVQFGDVAELPASLVHDAVAYGGQVLLRHGNLVSLLDTRRLRDLLERLLPFEAMHRNIRAGLVDAVAVATTSVDTGGTVVFVEKRPTLRLPPVDAERNIRYVQTELTVDHVLASAAVPIAFRPVALARPRGYYIDGGVRLNTPLKPAIALGSARLAVVATHPATPAPRVPPGGRVAPDVFTSAALVMRAVLADRMVEDLWTLSKVNTLVGAGARTTYRAIPFVFAGPQPHRADELGVLADRCFESEHGASEGLHHRDVLLLRRLLGGSHGARGELLSFLLFDAGFTVPAAELGAHHVRVQAAGRNPVTWRTTVTAPGPGRRSAA